MLEGMEKVERRGRRLSLPAERRYWRRIVYACRGGKCCFEEAEAAMLVPCSTQMSRLLQAGDGDYELVDQVWKGIDIQMKM